MPRVGGSRADNGVTMSSVPTRSGHTRKALLLRVRKSYTRRQSFSLEVANEAATGGVGVALYQSGKRHLFDSVLTGRRMHFHQLGHAVRWKPVGEVRHRWPHAPMYKRDLPLDEPTDQDRGGRPNGERVIVKMWWLCGCAHQLPRTGSPRIVATSDGTGPDADSRTTPWVATNARASSTVTVPQLSHKRVGTDTLMRL